MLRSAPSPYDRPAERPAAWNPAYGEIHRNIAPKEAKHVHRPQRPRSRQGRLAQPPGLPAHGGHRRRGRRDLERSRQPGTRPGGDAAARPAAGTGSRPIRSASSCSPCATSSPSTSRAPSPRCGRSATRGSSTPASSAGPSRSSRRCWTPPARGDLRPRPHPPALRPGRLERLARRRQHSGVPLHRAPVLRDRLRHRRGDSDHGAVAGVRARPEPGRPHGPGCRAEAWLPQPQLGVLPADRQPLADRLRRPHRHDRSRPRASGDGPVLGHSGRARPGGHHRAEQGPDPAVPRQGPEPGRQLHGPR